MTQGENLLDNDCPYCILRREIIAVRFSLLRLPAAVFVCPSCGSAVADDDGTSNEHGHPKDYFFMRAMRKAVLTAGVVFCLAATAMAQNVSNTRDRHGNLVRSTAPINNTQPMINSTANNPVPRPPNVAPTADQNLSPTSADVSRMLGQRK
jgi:hypothetical protein